MPFVILLVIFIYLINRFIHRDIVTRPGILFSIIWGLIMVFHQMRLFSLPTVSQSTYMIIFWGIFGFLLGDLLADHVTIKLGKGTIHRTFSKRRLNFMTVLFFAGMITPFSRAISRLPIYTLYDIRYNLNSEIVDTGFVGTIYNYYCQPFLTFLTVYACVNIFSSKRDSKLFILALIGIFMNTIIGGGRFSLLYLGGSLVLMLILYRREMRSTFAERKVMRKVLLLIALTVIVLITVSTIRAGENSILRTLYVYTCGSVPFLEHVLKTYQSDFLFGLASFNGFIRPIFVVLRSLFGFSLPTGVSNVESLLLNTDRAYYLTPTILYNSFVSCFYAPYIDGGLIGEFIIMFIIGFASARIYKNTIQNFYDKNGNDEFSKSLYVLVGLLVVLSFFRLLISSYIFALAFVYLLICFPSSMHSVGKKGKA